MPPAGGAIPSVTLFLLVLFQKVDGKSILKIQCLGDRKLGDLLSDSLEFLH